MRNWPMVLARVAIALAVLLILVYFGMGYVIYTRLADVKGSCDAHMANRPDNFALHPEWPAGFSVADYYMTPYELARIASREPGIEVAGWWVPADAGAPAVIIVEGGHGCKNSIAALAPAGMLRRNGFNVLLIDLRDTGDSTFEDGRSAMGNEEFRDVLGAWDWLVEQRGFAPERVGLFANSLGGATALYAFSEEPRVAALFLQSTFGNLQEVIAAELTRNGYPAFLSPGAIVMGRVIGGDNLLAHNPLDAIRKAGARPVYIVHTRADERIAIEQSEQLATAAKNAGVNVTTWFPENGAHVQTPAAYPVEFEQRMVGFFGGALAR